MTSFCLRSQNIPALSKESDRLSLFEGLGYHCRVCTRGISVLYFLEFNWGHVDTGVRKRECLPKLSQNPVCIKIQLFVF